MQIGGPRGRRTQRPNADTNADDPRPASANQTTRPSPSPTTPTKPQGVSDSRACLPVPRDACSRSDASDGTTAFASRIRARAVASSCSAVSSDRGASTANAATPSPAPTNASNANRAKRCRRTRQSIGLTQTASRNRLASANPTDCWFPVDVARAKMTTRRAVEVRAARALPARVARWPARSRRSRRQHRGWCRPSRRRRSGRARRP